MKLLKRADFARLIGISSQSLTYYKKLGRIVYKDNLIDVDATLAKMKAEMDPTKNQKAFKVLNDAPSADIPEEYKLSDENAAISYRRFRAEKIKHESRLAELDVEERIKNLVPKDVIEYCLSDYTMAFVAVLNNWPDQIAPRMLGFTDIHEARQFMENEIDILKQTLHDSVSRCHANLAE